MPVLEQLVDTLCRASRKDYANPYQALDWPEALDSQAWHFSPELISLCGSPAYEGLDEGARQRLSFLEAVNFFSLNIHGEKALVEGLAQRLYRKGEDVTTAYLHHFLDEENKHMVYFGTFCLRYAGKIYPDRKMVLPRDYAPGEEEFLFFAKVLVFEEIVDLYNKRMAKDARLHPLAREINRLHHHDESRHLSFGRQLVADLFDRAAPAWSSETLEGVRAYLADYIRSTWQEYYNPDVYQDAGLSKPYELRREMFDSPAARAYREEMTRPWCGVFVNHGILLEAPFS